MYLQHMKACVQLENYCSQTLTSASSYRISSPSVGRSLPTAHSPSRALQWKQASKLSPQNRVWRLPNNQKVNRDHHHQRMSLSTMLQKSDKPLWMDWCGLAKMQLRAFKTMYQASKEEHL